MGNPILLKNRTASGAIAAHRIVARSGTEGVRAQAASVTDKLSGICAEVGPANGERFDEIVAGLADVQYGGVVTEGDELTSDADGKAVAVTAPRIHQSGIAGGVAGAHAVAAVLATDVLVSVLAIDATDATESIADLTAEFAVTGAGAIGNVGGTDTTGKLLVVTWRNPDVHIIGSAEVSGTADEIGLCRVEPRILRA
ncbi:MAG: hypothetical protein PHH47_10010 [Gallionella sp.]|nr:hypothetical protein [Gallionella sp.]MDD4947200.1 hypothetical protein [Gallionella sp.]MDD5611874.1 hypothetical protein [Gallionella sp.]